VVFDKQLVSDLAGPGFKLQTSRTRVNTRPSICFTQFWCITITVFTFSFQIKILFKYSTYLWPQCLKSIVKENPSRNFVCRSIKYQKQIGLCSQLFSYLRNLALCFKPHQGNRRGITTFLPQVSSLSTFLIHYNPILSIR